MGQLHVYPTLYYLWVYPPARTNRADFFRANAIQHNQNQGTFHACQESSKSNTEITKQ
jgi:hypothetical protein